MDIHLLKCDNGWIKLFLFLMDVLNRLFFRDDKWIVNGLMDCFDSSITIKIYIHLIYLFCHIYLIYRI